MNCGFTTVIVFKNVVPVNHDQLNYGQVSLVALVSKFF